MNPDDPLKAVRVVWYYRADRRIWEGKGINLLGCPAYAAGTKKPEHDDIAIFCWPQRLEIESLHNCEIICSTNADMRIHSAATFRLVATAPDAKIVGILYHEKGQLPKHGVLTEKGPM